MSPWVTSVAGASPYGDLLVTVPITHLARAHVMIVCDAEATQSNSAWPLIRGLGLSPLPYYPHGHGTVSLKSLTQITTSLELSQIPMG
jgi:hypothetical protein